MMMSSRPVCELSTRAAEDQIVWSLYRESGTSQPPGSRRRCSGRRSRKTMSAHITPDVTDRGVCEDRIVVLGRSMGEGVLVWKTKRTLRWHKRRRRRRSGTARSASRRDDDRRGCDGRRDSDVLGSIDGGRRAGADVHLLRQPGNAVPVMAFDVDPPRGRPPQLHGPRQWWRGR